MVKKPPPIIKAGAHVVIATGLTSEEADDLMAAIKAPPSTATDVKKIAEAGGRFNVEATFPVVHEGSD